MEDTARTRRLLRLANRQQVLTEILKATADSLQDLLADINTPARPVDGGNGLVVTPSGVAPAPDAPDLPSDRCICGHQRGSHGIGGKCLGTATCQCTRFRWFGPAAVRPQDPLDREHVTRGTLQGLLDRADDALERGDQSDARGALRDLRHAIDGLVL